MTEFEIENLKPLFKDKRILLGVTGSIAAFKACELVRLLKTLGAQVRCILSESALKFVTPLTLETLSENPVASTFWEPSPNHFGTHHIATARWADLILVSPATAHFIGKLAGGLADDLLSTEILAFQGPLLVAPAMNPAMYANPAVKENLLKIKSRGTFLLGPVSGSTACGEEGLGRMTEPSDQIRELAQILAKEKATQLPRAKRPLKFLVTLGPTRSYLDPIRYLTNRSSGKMGSAVAWAAFRAGYEVTVVAGPHSCPLPPGCISYSVQTNSEMLRAVQQNFDSTDVFISAAAVLDWEFESFSEEKLKKEKHGENIQFPFKKGEDILKWSLDHRILMGESRESPLIIGFAAETNKTLENALAKIERKKCDAIFANDVSIQDSAFESSWNQGWWIEPNQRPLEIPRIKKVELASYLVELISGLRSTRKLPSGLTQSIPYNESSEPKPNQKKGF